MKSEPKKYIITGIGTDVGKTVVSAIIAQALKASYWKPIQAGELENSDSIKVFNWTEDDVVVLHEAFRLTQPMSPHAAANYDGLKIDRESITFPDVDGNLIIEGAGGVMVPINNDGLLFIDLFAEWNFPMIIVSRHYIGSINHTLLTIEALKNRNIQIKGIIFVGDENKETESIILEKSQCKMIIRIPLTKEVNTSFIQEQAFRLRQIINIEL
jgi:dethiobiotin synthetase